MRATLTEQNLLRDTFQQYATEILEFLKTYPPPMEFRHYLEPVGNQYTATTLSQNTPNLRIWIDSARDSIQRLPGVEAFAQVLRSELDQRHTATPLATFTETLEITDIVETVVNPLIIEMLDVKRVMNLGVFTFEVLDDAVVDICLKYLFEYIETPKRLFNDYLVILSGVNTNENIEFQQGVTLRQMDFVERHRYHFDDDPIANWGTARPFQTQLGIKDIFVLDIVPELLPNALNIADNFFLLCQLNGLPEAGYVELLQKSKNPILRRNLSKSHPSFGGSRSSTDYPDEVPPQLSEFPQIWSNSLAAWSDKSIQVAIHRYLLSLSRPTFEDQMIDLWICLESVFGRDTNAESTYRISLRIARLFGEDLESRKSIQKRVKKSYELRSKLVHGSHVELSNLDIELIEYTKDLGLKTLKRIVIGGWRPNYPELDLEISES